MENIEIWKDIEGFEGLYQVSNKGRVRSLDRYIWNHKQKGKVLKPQSKNNKYLQVSLSNKGSEKKCKHTYIHILVAKAFIPNPRGCTQVNHKDFDKTNNHVENLEWVTQQENLIHFRESLYCRKVEEEKNRRTASKVFDRILKHKDQIIDVYNSGLSVEETAKIVGVGRDFTSGVLKIFGLL